jgi:hypothetical protein
VSLLSFRKDRVDRVLGGKYAPSQATVTTFRAGATVNGNQGPVNTITVRRAHRFPSAGSVKLIVMRYTGGEWSMVTNTYRTVTASTETTVTFSGTALTVLDNDYLVNLGNDSGVGSPLFDASPVDLYGDPEGKTTRYSSSSVTPNTKGDYWYFTREDRLWEVVRNGTSPVAMILDALQTSGERSARWAHMFATGGTGTAADPWVTSGSNPIQAAYNDLPTLGPTGKGIVFMQPGCYSLGSGSTGFVVDGAGSHIFGFSLIGLSRGSRVSQDGGVNASYINDQGATLLYGGTGAAIKIGEFSTTGSKVLEGCVLRNFKVRQSGTKGTGIGILARLFRSGSFEDVNVADFSTGIGLASVSDFNTFDRVQVNDCHAFGIDLARTTDENGAALLSPNGQNNGNTFNDCYVCLTSRDTAYLAFGIRVDANAVKTVIRNCKIQNYDTAPTGGVTYAGILVNSGVSSASPNTTTVDGCYFEGNYAACFFNNPNASPTEQFGLAFTNNYVAQIEGYGVLTSSGAGGLLNGIYISGNTFTAPSTSGIYSAAVGVLLHTNTRNCYVVGNNFNVLNVAGRLGGGNIVHGGLGEILADNFISGTQRQTGTLTLDAGLVVGTTLAVTGAATLSGSVAVTGDLTVSGQLRRSVAAAVTASTTHTQVGGTALTKDLNNVSVCANADDAVTLPTAVAGMTVTVINSGAQPLRIWPASGDNLGTGADTVRAQLAAAGVVRFVALDATNWKEI